MVYLQASVQRRSTTWRDLGHVNVRIAILWLIRPTTKGKSKPRREFLELDVLGRVN
jgi:hypothetical protein